jgi:hypothetical protein
MSMKKHAKAKEIFGAESKGVKITRGVGRAR